MIAALLRLPLKIAGFLLLVPLLVAWSFVLFLAGDGTQTTMRMR